jgi:hypothetical protein
LAWLEFRASAALVHSEAEAAKKVTGSWDNPVSKSFRLCLSEVSFPPANVDQNTINMSRYYGYDTFAYVVLPSGGVQREYFEEAAKTLQVDRLEF